MKKIMFQGTTGSISDVGQFQGTRPSLFQGTRGTAIMENKRSLFFSYFWG